MVSLCSRRRTNANVPLADHPKPLAEVADRFHLTPLIRTMTTPHDIFVLALSEEQGGILACFRNLPPAEIKIAQLPKGAAEATRRPSVHVRAPRGHLQNLEGQKFLLNKYARKVDQALRGVLAGRETPLVLAAAEPLASIFRSVNTYPRLVDDVIAGNPDHVTDAQLADAARPVLDRLYKRELEAAIARYDELKPRLATDDVSYAAHAATAGAIDQLVVDLDAVIPGLVSDFDGSVTYATSDDAEPIVSSTKWQGARCAPVPGFSAREGTIYPAARRCSRSFAIASDDAAVALFVRLIRGEALPWTTRDMI